MNKLLFFSFVFIVWLISCKKDEVNPNNSNTGNGVTPAMARDSLYYVMKEYYYWYNMPEAVSITESNKNNYKDPYELLEAMRYRKLDRWSFVADYDDFNSEMNGSFVGHGFRLGIDISGNARIAMIYNNSPLYKDGVRRGWIVKKINSLDVAAILLTNNPEEYLRLIGPSEAGVTNIFLFIKPDGSEVTISSTKSNFTINTVLLYDTLHLSTGIAGQLVFESFINPSSNELATAFAFFKANNINDLILDLRYNSGGYLSIARDLASYIAGDSKQGSVFANLKYNAKHQEANSTFPFKTLPGSIGLTRLVLITSRATASASEAVINGLKPFLNLVTIGDTTDGKPTGMNGWDIGKKYYMWPVTFQIVNALDQGDYYDGFFPAKVVQDDITHDFSDREELCLKEAIYYLENGSVSTKGVMEFKRFPVFSEKPKWLNNVFIDAPLHR
jgi:C-terminal processing protease CtpA/Prc